MAADLVFAWALVGTYTWAPAGVLSVLCCDPVKILGGAAIVAETPVRQQTYCNIDNYVTDSSHILPRLVRLYLSRPIIESK